MSLSAHSERPVSRVVAFTKDWNDVPTCTTHILRTMAVDRDVLWINSIGTRSPRLGSGQDLRRVFARLRRGLGRAEWKENRLRVLSPLLVPGARRAWARRLNRRILRFLLDREGRREPPAPVEYWCFVPNAVDLLPEDAGRAEDAEGRRGDDRAKVIYYCVDDWSRFENLDGAWLAGREAELIRRADAVFTPSRYLEDKCRRARAEGPGREEAGGRVHYVPHGVEFARFAAALDGSADLPEDVRSLPRPRIGFYGNLYPWIDFALVARLARERPQWSFVVIGQAYCDLSILGECPNVRLLGRREHADLPSYCRAFDAAMIPYDAKHPRMASVNPVKTKELLAAGVPVAAADIPELTGYGSDVIRCRTDAEWLAALESQVRRTDRAAISNRVRSEDWGAKVRALRAVVDAT